MFAKKKALVGGVDHDGVGRETGIVKEFQYAANVVIHTFDAAQVVVHVAVVFPFGQLAARLEMSFQKRLVARHIIVVPDFLLFGR